MAMTARLHDFYPKEWPQLAYEIKAANGWRCMACDCQCRRPGEMKLKGVPILTVAHLTQDYEAEWVQVAALCRLCHLRHDAHLSWVARRRQQRWRRQRAGQLPLGVI